MIFHQYNQFLISSDFQSFLCRFLFIMIVTCLFGNLMTSKIVTLKILSTQDNGMLETILYPSIFGKIITFMAALYLCAICASYIKRLGIAEPTVIGRKDEEVKEFRFRYDSLKKIPIQSFQFVCCPRHPSGIDIHQVNPGTARETSHPSSAVFILQIIKLKRTQK
ncbi:hypothetical protein GDO81_010569 [Engystomops pustulosus]|uniref:Uncharacterized protein n=1 Tax=Engystomops pustulosus TaxID=76066 RepID=A0AAV7C1Z2_ENGPU|nr:hypothetical protein GDO81_010569 [Engystomops pustulosus]